MQEDRKMRRCASVSPRVNDGCQSKPVPVKRQRKSGDETSKKRKAQDEASASLSGRLLFAKWKSSVAAD